MDFFKSIFRTPVVRVIDNIFLPTLTERDNTVANNVIVYEAWAADTDTKTTDDKWMIRKTIIATAGSIVTTTVAWAEGKKDFRFKWSERTTLQYSY